MGLMNTPGSVPKEKHRANLSSLEMRTNEDARDKFLAEGKQKFPMHVHKAGGLVREVTNDEQLSDALSKGWLEDIRDVEAPEKDAPESIREMTVAQAAELIKAASPSELAKLEAEETLHGGRAEVLKLIDAAKDAVPAPKKARK